MVILEWPSTLFTYPSTLTSKASLERRCLRRLWPPASLRKKTDVWIVTSIIKLIWRARIDMNHRSVVLGLRRRDMPILPGKEGEGFRMKRSTRSKKMKRSKSSPPAFLFDYSGKGWWKMITQSRKINVSIAHRRQAAWELWTICSNTCLPFLSPSCFKGTGMCWTHLVKEGEAVHCWPEVHVEG